MYFTLYDIFIRTILKIRNKIIKNNTLFVMSLKTLKKRKIQNLKELFKVLT